jgi:hypothetical protein
MYQGQRWHEEERKNNIQIKSLSPLKFSFTGAQVFIHSRASRIPSSLKADEGQSPELNEGKTAPMPSLRGLECARQRRAGMNNGRFSFAKAQDTEQGEVQYEPYGTLLWKALYLSNELPLSKLRGINSLINRNAASWGELTPRPRQRRD